MPDPTPRPWEVHLTAVRMVLVEAATEAEAEAAAEQQICAERRWLTRHHWRIRDVVPQRPWEDRHA